MATRWLWGVGAVGWLWVTALAHPMGNFSVNRHARFDVRPAGASLTYILELAEQPAFELMERWKIDATHDREAAQTRAAREAGAWVQGLKVTINGTPATLRLERAEARVTEGSGGLPVLRVVTLVSLPPTSGAVEYEDGNYAGRAGWSEIVVVSAPGVWLEATTHGAEDRSHTLTSYPEDRAHPPQDVRAKFRWSAHAGLPGQTAILPKDTVGPASPESSAHPHSGVSFHRDYLARLISGGHLTPLMLAAGFCVAFGLGAMHALSPGHGKTIVAAYLVGNRGTMKHAMLLGGVVTFTHTVSVFALGIAVLLFENYMVPDRVIPLLGAASGLSIVAIGTMLLYQRAGALAHHYQHVHGHAHRHTFYHHDHAHEHDGHIPEGPVTLGALIALGVSGGLVPCPSALVLLLTSIALGRVALGLGLLVAFSAGLAMVLILIGVAVLYAKHLLPERTGVDSSVFRYVPVLSAAVVVVLGLLMTGVSLGWIRPDFAG